MTVRHLGSNTGDVIIRTSPTARPLAYENARLIVQNVAAINFSHPAIVRIFASQLRHRAAELMRNGHPGPHNGDDRKNQYANISLGPQEWHLRRPLALLKSGLGDDQLQAQGAVRLFGQVENRAAGVGKDVYCAPWHALDRRQRRKRHFDQV